MTYIGLLDLLLDCNVKLDRGALTTILDEGFRSETPPIEIVHDEPGYYDFWDVDAGEYRHSNGWWIVKENDHYYKLEFTEDSYSGGWLLDITKDVAPKTITKEVWV